MRFTSRPYFVSAALFLATAAHAGTERTMSKDPASSDSASGRVAAERDSRAGTDADRADAPAPAPASSAEAAPAPQARADLAAKPTATIAAPDPADPVVQRIWSGP